MRCIAFDFHRIASYHSISATLNDSILMWFTLNWLRIFHFVENIRNRHSKARFNIYSIALTRAFFSHPENFIDASSSSNRMCFEITTQIEYYIEFRCMRNCISVFNWELKAEFELWILSTRRRKKLTQITRQNTFALVFVL